MQKFSKLQPCWSCYSSPKTLVPLLTALLLCCCQSVKSDASNSQQAGELPARAATVLPKCPIFFVTNRDEQKRGDSIKFGKHRSSELVFGEYVRNDCNDSLNKARLVLFPSEQALLNATQSTGTKKLAVFVHGYRKSFKGSMNCALQIARHLDIPLLVFAWPSKNNYFAYMADECTAEWSSKQLAKVLRDLGQSMGYRNIVIVSHSLGARMVEWSLKDLYAESPPKEQFAASLFFSPDIDRDTFLQNAPFLKRACATSSIFLDRHDTRIRISKFLHGSPRVGGKEAQPELSQMFALDGSLPNHHIPSELVAETVHRLGNGSTADLPKQTPVSQTSE